MQGQDFEKQRAIRNVASSTTYITAYNQIEGLEDDTNLSCAIDHIYHLKIV